ncbi:MAG: hypothetical protein HFE73_01090 [Firmicutes bacterium]|nr:hypothetical protein [Bacillota bacterium]
MNKRFLNSRYYQLLALILILMLILCIRLFVLTIFQQEQWTAAASNQSTKEITTSAPRGEILDRYGRVLATNKQLFTVTFNASGLSTEEINESAYKLVKLLEKNGDKDTIVDNFPIQITKKGNFKYTFDDEKKEWLKSQGFSKTSTAEEAFEKLRKKYEIDPDLDRFEALEVLQNTHNVYPPIVVRSMTFTYDNEKINFLTKYGLYDAENPEKDEILTAKEAFYALRELYKIDEFIPAGKSKVLSNKEARKIFIVREEIKSLGFNKYQSSTIAKGVSDETIAYVEEMGSELKGAEIASETVRYYPNGKLASHILGYMGSISDSEYDTFVEENGYNPDDLIGKDGIEASMESKLRGMDGVKTIQVNSSGDYIDTISETEPESGKSVYLTIDMDLQKLAERTLKNAIKAVQTGTRFKGKYGNFSTIASKNCGSGALVAIDVETGDVLAMASYPDYNPNIFAEGISYKDWASVQSTNPREPLAPTPLYNVATKASVQPGSIFKPVTSTAALEAGLNPDTPIYDKGYITIGDTTYGCDSWNRFRGSHGTETLVTGIQNSCNYYFYCIATGKNWQTGQSLGYEDKISIEKIMDVAKEFGLGEKTGIEIPESTTPLPSAEGKMQTMRTYLWYTLHAAANQYFPKAIYEDEELLKKNLNTICGWIEENPDRGTLINYIKEQTDVRESKIETVADLCKFDFFNQAQWTVGDEFSIAIGEGENAYTPLQIANYVATLGNDGKRNQVNIVKGIEGEGETAKPEPYQIDVDEAKLNKVLEGMRRVTTGGTLAGIFGNFPIAVAGKTGTADKDGKMNPKNEVAYVKNHLSQITSEVTWEQVQKQITKMMKEDPQKYPTENDAVDAALIKVSKNKVTQTQIDRYKEDYVPFAWTITLAPADNPKIAVVAMLIQGKTSYNAGIMTRELIGEYLKVSEDYASVDFSTRMQ